MGDDGLRRAAQNEVTQARVPIGSHDKQIDLARGHVVFESLPYSAPGGLFLFQDGLDPVTGEMFGQLRA